MNIHERHVTMSREVNDVFVDVDGTNMADEDDVVCLSAAAVAVIAARRRRRRKKKRSCWVRPWIGRRWRFGCCEALIKDVKGSEPKAYQNFCRMTSDEYDELLSLVTPIISHKDTNCRKAISPDDRLSLTLIFLATCIWSTFQCKY